MNPLLLSSYVALWILCVAQAVALLALYNHFGSLWFSSRDGRERQGPAIGARLDGFTVRTLDGRDVTVPGQRPTLLVLASTDCPECARLREPLGRTARAQAGELEVVVVCAGTREQVARWAAAVDPAVHVVSDKNYRRAAALGVGVTPFFVGATEEGTVRTKGLLNGEDGVAMAVHALLHGDLPAVSETPVTALAGGSRP